MKYFIVILLAVLSFDCFSFGSIGNIRNVKQAMAEICSAQRNITTCLQQRILSRNFHHNCFSQYENNILNIFKDYTRKVTQFDDLRQIWLIHDKFTKDFKKFLSNKIEKCTETKKRSLSSIENCSFSVINEYQKKLNKICT